MTPSLHVVVPGLLTTIQDIGRVGYQHLGVPVSGALDPVSLHAANTLVGNPPGAAALEVAAFRVQQAIPEQILHSDRDRNPRSGRES